MVDESVIAEKDKEIAALRQEIHQKDTFISQQRREIVRLKEFEDSLFFGIAKKLSDLTNRALLPSGTKRGRFSYRLIQWIREHSRKPHHQGEERNSVPWTSADEIKPVEPLAVHGIVPLRFRKVARPEVSIIIPTWNRAASLYHCLKSVVEKTSGVSYEVLVVDNGSTDETSELIGQVENIRAIRNETNLGFVKACNEGARNAGGEHLLFLNNDTEVTEGWLNAMVDLIKADPTIGAVGARLILPDGSLQEAGSIIWRDGSALGYGRGGDPDHPQFCYPRDVDFCSGACLLVRKEVFVKLGGFDEIYSPAYYEDADLCMGVRDLGLRVVYQPDATIIHHEFGSSSKKKSMELCSHNRGKFAKKWGRALQVHLPGRPESILYARDTRKGKRVLVLDDIIPVSSMGSGYPRSNAILRDLADLGYIVTFYPLSADSFPHQPYTNVLKRMGIEVFYGEKTNIHEFLRERKGFYEAILVSRPHNAVFIIEELKSCFPHARIIYDAEAVYANREINQLRLSGIEVSENKRREMIGSELAPMKYADAIIVTSEYERKQVSAFRDHDVFVWGHPVDVKTPEKPYSEREGLLFVGGFLRSPSPNEDAVLHFVKNIFPEIKRAVGSRLFVAGTNYLDSIKQLQSDFVNVTGYVENLSVYYERSRIFVVPTRFGAGISLKLLEAMSHGIPAVVTPLVASQLDLADGEGVLIGMDDADFAEKTIRLYRNESLWYELQKRGLKYVQMNCDREKMKQELDDIIWGKKPKDEPF